MQAVADHADELRLGVREPAAEAAHGERGADDHRIAEIVGEAEGLLDRVGDVRASHFGSGLDDQVFELLPVLALLNRLEAGADQFDVVLLQHAVLEQLGGGVEGCLAAEGRQDRIRSLQRDDRFDDFPGDRLDVGGVREVGVGHDRGRVGVDQDDPHALFAQDAAGLGAGVVELAGLTDDDRAGADDEDTVDVAAFGHQLPSAGLSVTGLSELVGVFRRSSTMSLNLSNR